MGSGREGDSPYEAIGRRDSLVCSFILNSSYPETVKEAALFNLATLRSQTVFRLPSGHLMGWEGIMDRFGSCQGSCTHVWNYEMATPFCSVVWHRQCAMWSLTMPRKRMG